MFLFSLDGNSSKYFKKCVVSFDRFEFGLSVVAAVLNYAPFS